MMIGLVIIAFALVPLTCLAIDHLRGSSNKHLFAQRLAAKRGYFRV